MELTMIPRSSFSYLALSSSWIILAEATLIPDLLEGTTRLLGYLPPSHRTKSHKIWYSRFRSSRTSMKKWRRRLASRFHPYHRGRGREICFSPAYSLQYSADTTWEKFRLSSYLPLTTGIFRAEFVHWLHCHRVLSIDNRATQPAICLLVEECKKNFN